MESEALRYNASGSKSPINMPDIPIVQSLFLLGFAFLAGLIDSIAGGGGLIQLPALMAILPNAPVVFLLGTNKLASSLGTSMAISQYSRKVPIEWKKVLPIAGVAFGTGILGARVATSVPNYWMRPLVLVLLVIVLLYTLLKKELGAQVRQVPFTDRNKLLLSLLAGLVIGFYDGFFGPGTGNFLILALIGIFGMDFLHASASCKIINLATNLGALILFGAQGSVYIPLGLLMAVFNIAGNFLGVQLAVLKGSKFIRVLFIVVVAGLLVKQGIDYF